jgi:hypothetical protein
MERKGIGGIRSKQIKLSIYKRAAPSMERFFMNIT